ncbi:MAG: leucine-rich repeat domain-containing protein [Candidatus Latescibacterota bacterium]
MRDALARSRGAVTEDDLPALTELDARGRGIVRLDGIEQLAHLRVLDLSMNLIYDLGPLAALTELELLNLEENRISDLRALRPLAALRRLMLANNQIRELAPLADLPSLASVDLVGNPLDQAAATRLLRALVRRGVEVSSDLVLEDGAPAAGSGSWVALGPTIEEHSLYVATVAAATRDPQTVYAGAGHLGIWVSRDGGATGQVSGLSTGLVTRVSTDAGDPRVLYAYVAFGAGLVRSRDGGSTWERLHVPDSACLLNADANVPGRLYAERRYAVEWTRWAWRPTRVATSIYVSPDYGETWAPSVLEWRQWVPQYRWPYPFVWSHPADPRRVWAGCYTDLYGRTTTGQVYLSEDGGRTFEPRALGRELADLVAHPADPHSLYGLDATGLWHSADDGETWKPAAALPRAGVGRLLVHPRDPGTMSVWSSAAVELWRSRDAGATWSRRPRPVVGALAPDYGTVSWDASDPSRGYAAAGRFGVARTTDGGASWDVRGLSANCARVVSLTADAEATIYALVDPGDRFTFSYAPVDAWDQRQLIAGRLLASGAPSEPWVQLVFGTAHRHTDLPGAPWADTRHPGLLFSHATPSGWLRSTDAGGSWTLVRMSGEPSTAVVRDKPVASPEGAGVVYARDPADTALYRSSDTGLTWQKITDRVDVFAVHPNRSGALLAAEDVGPVRLSADSGRTWSVLGACPSGERVLCLAVHPLRPDQVCAACTGGLHAMALAGSQPRQLLEAQASWWNAEIAFDPADPGDLCVLANGALWDTDDGGRTWRVLNDGPGAPTHIDALAVDPSDGRVLLVGTPTGVYRLQRPAPATAITEAVAPPLPAAVRLMPAYPNPFNGSTVIGYWLPRPALVEIAVHDILGQRVVTLVQEMRAPGHHAITWDGRDGQGRPVGSGVYVCRLVAGGSRALRRLVLAR